ncbi:MAG TPA: hypothetical protein VHC95_03920 [Opitutales bacterium]|nr:hypothetical protein [Opitutales bacterium]
MPQDALNLLRRLSGHRQMCPESLAEGVEVEAALFRFKGNTGALQVTLEGFNFRNMTEEGTVCGILEGQEVGSEFFQDGRSNLDNVEPTILGERGRNANDRLLALHAEIRDREAVCLVVPQAREVEHPVNKGPHVGGFAD